MCLELSGLVHKLAIDRMFHLTVDGNSDRFLHFVAQNFADPFFTFVPFQFHGTYFCNSLALSSVFKRATSLRLSRSFIGFSMAVTWWANCIFRRASFSALILSFSS